METIDKLTELAQKVMQFDDTERKYKAVANLQQRIIEDIGGVISACTDLIEDNRTLRFGYYQSDVFMMYGQYNTARRCINLLKDHYSDVVGYENDTEEKRAERKNKLEQHKQTVSCRMPVKNKTYRTIRDGGMITQRTVVERYEDPNKIYYEKGIYRLYNSLYNTFEYRLCRKIQQTSGGDLKTLFQEVCLYIALKNERAMMREELVLLGIDVPTEEITANRQNEENHTGVITGWVKEAFKAAIEAGYMENPGNGYKWLYGGERGNVRLAFFLQRVFNYNGCSSVPYKQLEALFGVKNLAQTTDQLNNAKKAQKWKNEILKIIPQHP